MDQSTNALASFSRRSTPEPSMCASTLVCDTARVVGDVVIGAMSSIWYGAVLRADNGPIRIGECTNIQDNAVLHMSPGTSVRIGNYVSVGHLAVLHGCEIENNCLIGMRALLMNGAHIGANSIVAAGTVVKKGLYPPNSVIVDSAVHRLTTQEDWERIRANALEYKALLLRVLGPGVDVDHLRQSWVEPQAIAA